jgi:DNA-binding XRE family transcriptional regulator
MTAMTKTKPFAELSAKVKADPVRRARIAVEKQAIEDALTLAELRSQLSVTQQKMARTLGVTQANISRIEHEEDLYLSTLRTYLSALGADLEVNAVFRDGRVTLGTVNNWLGMTEARTESPPVVTPGATPLPSVVEAHLRADRNLDSATAGLLARMFRAAYEEVTEKDHGEVDHPEDDSAASETIQETK